MQAFRTFRRASLIAMCVLRGNRHLEPETQRRIVADLAGDPDIVHAIWPARSGD